MLHCREFERANHLCYVHTQNFRIVNKMRVISIHKHTQSKHDRKIAVNMKNFFIIVRSLFLFFFWLNSCFPFPPRQRRHHHQHRIIYTCLLNLVIYVHCCLNLGNIPFFSVHWVAGSLAINIFCTQQKGVLQLFMWKIFILSSLLRRCSSSLFIRLCVSFPQANTGKVGE